MPSVLLYLGLCSCEGPLDNGANNVEAVVPTQEPPVVTSLQDDSAAPVLGRGSRSMESLPVLEGAAPLTTTNYTDDLAAPVHVQVKECTSTTALEIQSVDCTLDSGYALAGGGAYAAYTGPGALLTASRYADGLRTWHGASKDHQAVDMHNLKTYAIGLRLDGVNAATLRGLLSHATITVPPVPTAHPSVCMGRPQGGTSAGAQTNTSGPGQLLTSVFMDNSCGTAASKDHIVSSPGTITDSLTMLYGTFGYATIIEGFGALDFQYLSGTPSTVSTGVGTSTGAVSAGWALAGYGGNSTYTSGPGRMLFRVGANGDARSVVVQSKDHLYVSAGSTTASWTQVRKTPGSHGLCNPGGVLSAGMDSCVASICTSDSYCCNTSWDAQCVGEVSSICGRSCANYTCGLSSYNPSVWNDTYNIRWNNNCYNYSNNHRTDTFAQPGRASGEEYTAADVPTVTKYAQNDGLIATTLAAGCPDGRELLAMAIAPSIPDYHWYRHDTNNNWSHKPGHDYVTNIDNSKHLITNPETADRGAYTVFGGYFCSCSSATEGAGHAVIN